MNKYIERTKRKTKNGELPALSTLTPIMPDGAAGIETFNNSFGDASGEGVSENMNDIKSRLINEAKTIDSLKSQIVNAVYEYMESEGFEEDEVPAYTDVDIEDETDSYKITVSAEVSYDGLVNLIAMLDPIVQEYDKDSYFNAEVAGRVVAYVQKSATISEKLHAIDKRTFDKYNECYELETLYESINNKLSSKDKQELKDFINKTDDPEQINIYIKGLTDDDNMNEEIDDPDNIELIKYMNEYLNDIISQSMLIEQDINYIIDILETADSSQFNGDMQNMTRNILDIYDCADKIKSILKY